MPETFLNKAQLTGLSKDARRTEILRARGFAALDTRTTALESATTPSAWTAPTLTNSWLNYGGGYQTAQYRKVGDIVYLRGSIGAGTLGSAAITLPAGFRPPAQIQFEPSGTVDYIDVTTGGAVVPAGGSNTVASLDGIQFSVTA